MLNKGSPSAVSAAAFVVAVPLFAAPGNVKTDAGVAEKEKPLAPPVVVEEEKPENPVNPAVDVDAPVVVEEVVGGAEKPVKPEKIVAGAVPLLLLLLPLEAPKMKGAGVAAGATAGVEVVPLAAGVAPKEKLKGAESVAVDEVAAGLSAVAVDEAPNENAGGAAGLLTSAAFSEAGALLGAEVAVVRALLVVEVTAFLLLLLPLSVLEASALNLL